MEKIALTSEKQIYRIGNQVERPTQPWSLSVQRLLKHFENNGLPVERIISTDENTQISEFCDGETVHPKKWTDDALYSIGGLVSQLHKSAKNFAESEGDIWQPWNLRKIGDINNRIHCHGDIAPWNMITENGLPKLLVDWEFAGPLDPFIELARVCWLFVQLHDDDLMEMYDLPGPEKRAQQVRIIADAYGLTKTQRQNLVNQIIEVIICETAHEAIDPQLTPDSTGNLWGFAWRTRSLYWVWRNKQALNRQLM
jgi:thiamine kinase-like enzyme